MKNALVYMGIQRYAILSHNNENDRYMAEYD